MRSTSLDATSRFVSLLCGLILLGLSGRGDCQKISITPAIPVEIHKVFDPDRIGESRHKLVMYNQDEDTVSNLSILVRQIVRDNYEGKPAVRITELRATGDSVTKTISYVRRGDLAPLYSEDRINDVVIQKAFFDQGRETVIKNEHGIETKSVTSISPSTFLSSSFSELLQANDFSKHPVVQFETVNPGNPPNHFVAEVFGRHTIVLSRSKHIECWVVKFTRMDPEGRKSSAGFRYIDKASGRVLMYKSDLESRKLFTYQVLMFE